MQAVTIDFHNTLFQCDDWFQLEIRTLPVEFLIWRGEFDASDSETEISALATAAYSNLRKNVIASGIECDAVSSVEIVLRELEIPVRRQELEAGVAEVMGRTVESARPTPGATELVERLDDAGITLAVVSSAAYHPFLEWCLEHWNLNNHFQEVVTSARCGIYKSDPRIYAHTLELLNVSPQNALHIGDSHRFDVASAGSIGMRTVLFNSQVESELNPEPDLVIDSLGDAFPELVRLLGQDVLT